MIIKTKGLAKAMREAYNYTGYHVASMKAGYNQEQMVIYTDNWLVRMARTAVPNDILGLIVKHSGMLPRVGEAFKAMKGCTQYVIFASAETVVEDLGKRRLAGPHRRMAQTKLTVAGNEVWQTEETLRIILLDPEHTAMVDMKELSRGNMESDIASFHDGASDVYIFPVKPGVATEKELEHLEQMQWVEI